MLSAPIVPPGVIAMPANATAHAPAQMNPSDQRLLIQKANGPVMVDPNPAPRSSHLVEPGDGVRNRHHMINISNPGGPWYGDIVVAVEVASARRCIIATSFSSLLGALLNGRQAVT